MTIKIKQKKLGIRNFHLTLDVFKYIFKLLKYVYSVQCTYLHNNYIRR